VVLPSPFPERRPLRVSVEQRETPFLPSEEKTSHPAPEERSPLRLFFSSEEDVNSSLLSFFLE